MINNLQEKFAALSQREKIIVVAATLMLCWAVWDNLFYQPTQNKQKNLQEELANLKQQLSTQQLIANKLEHTDHIDPNKSNRDKLAALKSEYDRQKKLLLQSGGKNFAHPNLMANALNDILSSNKELTLIKLDTLPASKLLDAKQAQVNPIYKHGLIVTFAGNYLNTLNYLKALESLPWRFIWESIDYRVKEYPTAVITIELYTLSFKEIWLGV